MPHEKQVPSLIIPQAGDTMTTLMSEGAAIPKAAQLVTVNWLNGSIVLYADAQPVLSLNVPLALDLMARIAVACKEAIKGRP